LEKEPYSYEGLLLLAQIHIDLDQPERAMKAVDLILEKTQLTEDQRKLIQQTRKAVEESLLLTK
jgi:hypothetical protein